MKKKILITGGAGFIGCNSALKFKELGWDVLIFDNLSRKGTLENLKMLQNFNVENYVIGSICNFNEINPAILNFKPDVILHLAGQVAVTTSVDDPLGDFNINALGTLNILESLRLNKLKPTVLFSSTNKVYGGMEEEAIVNLNNRYTYGKLSSGVNEKFGLDFHSPYGCSKGAADQYVRDYFRIFDIPTVVLRQSCIYGQNQFGIEDQGWVSWFTIATSVLLKEITIYGDGQQVRDVLHVNDLINLYIKCIENIEYCKGEVFNIGGGADNTLSLLELVDNLSTLQNREIRPKFSDWRPGDQRVYISDIQKANHLLNWKPAISPFEGITLLYDWVNKNADRIKYIFPKGY